MFCVHFNWKLCGRFTQYGGTSVNHLWDLE